MLVRETVLNGLSRDNLLLGSSLTLTKHGAENLVTDKPMLSRRIRPLNNCHDRLCTDIEHLEKDSC